MIVNDRKKSFDIKMFIGAHVDYVNKNSNIKIPLMPQKENSFLYRGDIKFGYRQPGCEFDLDHSSLLMPRIIDDIVTGIDVSIGNYPLIGDEVFNEIIPNWYKMINHSHWKIFNKYRTIGKNNNDVTTRMVEFRLRMENVATNQPGNATIDIFQCGDTELDFSLGVQKPTGYTQVQYQIMLRLSDYKLAKKKNRNLLP